jgi:copper chaperone CopZ
MFNFLKNFGQKNKATVVDDPNARIATIKINGMHCTSCSLSIDGALEDVEGVVSANTSYAKSQTVVQYDPTLVTPEQLADVIKQEGYEASLS